MPFSDLSAWALMMLGNIKLLYTKTGGPVTVKYDCAMKASISAFVKRLVPARTYDGALLALGSCSLPNPLPIDGSDRGSGAIARYASESMFSSSYEGGMVVGSGRLSSGSKVNLLLLKPFLPVSPIPWLLF